MRKTIPLSDRFWSKVDRSGVCWIWKGLPNSRGYGQIKTTNTIILAHRLSYQINVGEIPVGMVVHHKCKNKLCVNPAHLELQKDSEHSDAGPAINRLKTHCPAGHEYSNSNTYFDGKSRRCRICYNTQEYHRRRQYA